MTSQSATGRDPTCPACRDGVPIENGRHRYGLPGGYPNWQACKAVSGGTKALSDYLIRTEK